MTDILKPIYPLHGNQLSASEVRDRLVDPLHQNDVDLSARIAALEALLSSTPMDFKQDTIPSSAKLFDRLWKADEDLQLYICTTAYTSEGTLVDNWTVSRDKVSATAAAQASALAGNASQVHLSDDIPDTARAKDIWIDTNASNKARVCDTTYGSGLGDMDYWADIDDAVSQLLAAAEQGLKDGKTNTYHQADVPESADARDGWVDLDNSNATYACTAAYTATDGLTYDSGKTYEIGEICNVAGTYYQATAESYNRLPPDAGYWTVVGTHANITAFRESRWVETADKAARDRADAAQALADGKTTNYYQDSIPNAADLKDLWVDTNDNNQVYVCIESYDDGGDLANWEKTADSVAQSKATLAKSQADRKTVNFFQDNMPTGADNVVDGFIDLGDGWIDTNDGNAVYVAKTRFKSAGTFQEKTHVNNDGKVWDGTTQFYAGDYVIRTGRTYVALADTLNEEPSTTPAVWEDKGTTAASDYIEWMAEQWEPTKDKAAQELALLAQGTADGKTTAYYRDEIPESANVGDTWVDTDANFMIRICKIAYTTNGSTVDNWQETQDPEARQTALDALSAADKKRTTFNTAYAGVPSAWPSPSGGMGSPISFWDAVGGASIGDMWIHTNTSTGLIYIYICKTAYSGYDDDVGGLGSWSSISDLGDIQDNYVKIAGSTMTGNLAISRATPIFTIDATTGVATVDFQIGGVSKASMVLADGNGYLQAVSTHDSVALSAESKRIVEVANPENANDAANKSWTESQASSAESSANSYTDSAVSSEAGTRASDDATIQSNLDDHAAETSTAHGLKTAAFYDVGEIDQTVPKWGNIVGNSVILGDNGYIKRFAKGTAHNKNFGTSAGESAEGNHTHAYDQPRIVLLADKEFALTGVNNNGGGPAQGGIERIYLEPPDHLTGYEMHVEALVYSGAGGEEVQIYYGDPVYPLPATRSILFREGAGTSVNVNTLEEWARVGADPVGHIADSITIMLHLKVNRIPSYILPCYFLASGGADPAFIRKVRVWAVKSGTTFTPNSGNYESLANSTLITI